jgi:hypothetical protein
VEVRVFLSHRDLNDVVQPRQCGFARNQQPPPYGWFAISKRPLDPVDLHSGLGFAHDLSSHAVLVTHDSMISGEFGYNEILANLFMVALENSR